MQQHSTVMLPGEHPLSLYIGWLNFMIDVVTPTSIKPKQGIQNTVVPRKYDTAYWTAFPFRAGTPSGVFVLGVAFFP